MKLYTHIGPFLLESGESLGHLEIAYSTFGSINDDASNIVWICHALTANSDVTHWWPGVVGDGAVIDPDRHFIVCANILGSCYGTSGPLNIDPATEELYYHSFPQVTIRDMVNAHILLRKHLGLHKIRLLIGGSMGGYQALEWCIIEPAAIDQLFLLATSASESAWGIAVHASQRMAIEADESWKQRYPSAGANGLKAARAIGMLTYRNYGIMVKQQSDEDCEKIDGFKAAEYIKYQGDKLAQRFNACSYWMLTKSMDSHQLTRGRDKKLAEILHTISQRTLIIGISSDILCPLIEQHFLADHIPDSQLIEIDSDYGHDGFMVESKIISQHLSEFLGGSILLGYGAMI